ncbi:hypothetical protein [Mesorhizobium sp. M1322]|uniref:hypothetical protein n=1 Tax=Mesorhizobium sp. M1322 TaxID=2957081 RepID=UPI0033394192
MTVAPSKTAIKSLADQSARDPRDELHDNLDKTDELPIEPLRLIATMAADGSLTSEERDAATILHKMARVGQSTLRDEGSYAWRDADGKWSTVREPRKATAGKVDEALLGIRASHRRVAVRHALVAVSPLADLDNLSPLAAGIEDLAAYWWSAKSKAPVRVTGISLARVSFGEKREETAEVGNAAGSPRRLIDGFERMATRKQLSADPKLNGLLHAAGLRYESEFRQTGLSPLGAIDYSRTYVDGSSGPTISERAEAARRKFAAAQGAMTPDQARVVNAVVLAGRALADVGVEVTAYKQRDMAAAVAKERLVNGLTALAYGYGLLERRRAA